MFEITRLSNGIQVVLEEIPFVRSISFGVWVKNGSRNETAAYSGISHFIEHMLFKGTKNRSAREIADEMDAVGGQMNAYTAKEYTCYYTRTLDTNFGTAVDILSDMILNPLFSNKDIEKERGVILEEISMSEDTPEDDLYDITQKHIWRDDPLGRPILGTPDTINQFEQGMMDAFYRLQYNPDNIVLAVAGNFKPEQVLTMLERYFGAIETVGQRYEIQRNTVFSPTVIQKGKDIEQVHLLVSFPGLKMGSNESYSLSVLNTLLGGGMSSRLFQSIREEHGLAYSVYSYASNYSDLGLFSIYAGMNAEQVGQVFHLILKEIMHMQEVKITQEQLQKTKEQLKSNYILSLESSSNRMSSLGKNQLMLKRILTPEDIIQRVDAVTAEDVLALAQKIMNKNCMAVTAVGNVKNFNLNEIVQRYIS